MMFFWGENVIESLGYSYCVFVILLIRIVGVFFKGDLIVNKLIIKFVFIFIF